MTKAKAAKRERTKTFGPWLRKLMRSANRDAFTPISPDVTLLQLHREYELAVDAMRDQISRAAEWDHPITPPYPDRRGPK